MGMKTAVGVVAGITLALAGCGGDDGGSGSDSGSDPIKIGVEVPATGQVAFYGTEHQRGYELALEKFNADGGVDGRKVEFDLRDNGSVTEESVINFKDFVSDQDIVATIGPTSSRDALVALELTEQAGIGSITLALAPDIMKIGDNVYRPIPADTELIPPFVDAQVAEKGIKTVAFLGASDDPNSLSVYEAYQAAFDDAGVETVARETYLGTDTEWSAQLLKIKRANPDVLVLHVLAQETGNLVTQVRATGIDAPLFGAAALNSQAAVDEAGDAANGIYLPDYWAMDFDSQENKDFIAAYQAEYNSAPTRFAASAYGAAFFLFEALTLADDPDDRASVLEAMGKVTEFPVIGSPLTMSDRQASTTEPVTLTVEDGKFKTVS